ncbi:MAG: gliding motility-associated C-terminal domain-containing protein [Deltaproteobacteria bacterium]
MKSGFWENFSIVIFIFISGFNLLSAQVTAPKPDTICSNADIFCDSASMVGPHTLPQDLKKPISQSVCTGNTFTGNFDNQLFFPFVPSSNEVIIDILIHSLQADATKPPSEAGYQWGIVDGCDFAHNNYILCDGSKIQATVTTIQGTMFKPGHTYYLYIDGYSGSEVTFSLRVRKGIGNLVVDNVEYFKVDGIGDFFAGDTVSVCHNGEFKIRVEGVSNAASYRWQVDGIKESSDSSLLYRFKNKNTVYKVEALGYTDCASSPFGTLYFKVDTIADNKLKDTVVCANDLSAGINPAGWSGGPINKDGISRFKIVFPNGCYYWQQVRVIKQIEPIVSIDTVLCNVGQIFFGGHNLTRDTIVQMRYSTTIGCDSIVNYRFYFMKFSGSLSDLECYNGSSYMLKVNAPGFNSLDYDSIKVSWLLNNVYYKETSTLQLFPITSKGIYSAVVTLYKNNRYCSFNVNSLNVFQIPDAAFILNTDVICETDSIMLSLNNFMNNVNYKITSQNSLIQNTGNGKYQLKWVSSGVYTIKVESDFKGCISDYVSQATIKKELNKPVLNCTKSTNTSVEFDWIESDSDCLDDYEIWINGVFQNTVHTGPSSISGLAYGEEVKITVKALSDCVCPGKKDSIVCKALPCPSKNIKIIGIPTEICSDELASGYQLNYQSDSPGTPVWTGDAVDNTGQINSSKLKLGKNYLFLKLTIGECVYSVDTSITVFPAVKFEHDLTDISCYNTEDGTVVVRTLQGTPEFNISLNGKSYSSNTISGLKSGKYDLEVTDSKGCKDQVSFTLNKPDKADLYIAGEDKINFNQIYTYAAETSSIDIDSLIWFLNDSIICANRFCDSVRITAEDDFSLCLRMIYGNNCSVEECIEIRINKDFDIYVPNVFTPNFDGVNDYFKIKSTNGIEVSVKTMKIFDRWGEMMFQRDNFTYGKNDDLVGWDGKFRERLAPPGVYVYYIEIIKDSGEITRLMGDITLLR